MAVVFKGGTSGNREDASPPVPSSGYKQPIQYTQTYGGEDKGAVVLNSNHFDSPVRNEGGMLSREVPHDMPTGGTEAQGTDLQDPTATVGGDQSVFVNTPYTGLKG